eukprot:scaffold3593_cov164-Skeletonema_dohrnii-CCMP3373.AAC.3
MNLITLLCKRFVAAVSVIVVLASVANLVNDSHFIVAEGALTHDSGEMMAAVKLMQRSQASMPNVAFLIGPLQARHFDQSSSRKTIERPLTSCAQQSYNHLPTYRSLTSIRMSSVSKATTSVEDVLSTNKLVTLTKDEQTIYKELSTLSQKIRSLDESYYGGATDIISDEEYDALARREAELCTAYPQLLLRLEEESGLGKEATRFGGRVGQSYKEIDGEGSADAEPATKTKKKKASTRSATKKRQKRKHLENVPMQSLDNAMHRDEVVLWVNRVKKLLLSASTADADPDDDSLDTDEQSIPVTIIAEPKIDGLSLSLRYELDASKSDAATSVYKFVWGATRGDGKQGEDVSEAVRSAWMKNSTSSDGAADIDQRFNVPNSFHISTNEHPPPKTIEIRGEVVLPQASFDEFTRNITASDNNKTTTFSNARNAASGILLRSKEPTSEEALEQTKWLQSRLTFYAYDIVASNQANEHLSSDWLSSAFTENSTKMRDSLSSIGFRVPNPVAMEDITFSPERDHVEDDIPSLLDYHSKLLENRDGTVSLPYHIDGVVYKVSSLAHRRICGSSSRTPRWAIAHKFPPLCGVTRLNGIEIQVGRTGALTPVAILAPVDLGGVMVARASLHNFHYASKILLPSNNMNSSTTDERKVNMGVEVLVSRAGDVIPQVMKRIFDDDGSSADGVISLEPPVTCPACGSPTTFGFVGTPTRKKGKKMEGAVEGDIKETLANDESNDDMEAESGQVLRCSGPQLLCQPRALNAMAYSYSRAGLDVKGLSKSKLQGLMDANIIRYPADLFVAFGDSNAENSSVGQEILSKIADLPGWGEISSQNVADSIRTVSAEGVTLSRFIYSLGIPFIGTHASQLLASQYGNVTRFLDTLDEASEYVNDASSDDSVDDSPFGTLSEVKGIGPAALSALLSFSKEEVLVKAAKDLAKALKVHKENQVADESIDGRNDTDSSPFEGLTVVFTGAVPGMSRTAAQAVVKQLGAKATPNTVSKSTGLVVEGEKGGKKANQARDLGIRVIAADDFLQIISS